MTECLCYFRRILFKCAQRRQASSCQPAFLSSTKDPLGDVILNCSSSPLSFQLFSSAGCSSSTVPAVILAVVEAMFASLTRACQSLLTVIMHFVVCSTVAALTDIKVLLSLHIYNFVALAHLLCGDVCCDCFDVDHYRVPFSTLLFASLIE